MLSFSRSVGRVWLAVSALLFFSPLNKGFCSGPVELRSWWVVLIFFFSLWIMSACCVLACLSLVEGRRGIDWTDLRWLCSGDAVVGLYGLFIGWGWYLDNKCKAKLMNINEHFNRWTDHTLISQNIKTWRVNWITLIISLKCNVRAQQTNLAPQTHLIATQASIHRMHQNKSDPRSPQLIILRAQISHINLADQGFPNRTLLIDHLKEMINVIQFCL